MDNNNDEQITNEEAQTTTPPVQEAKKVKCRDCYYGVYGSCSCGESQFVNRLIFPWTKGCEHFKI